LNTQPSYLLYTHLTLPWHPYLSFITASLVNPNLQTLNTKSLSLKGSDFVTTATKNIIYLDGARMLCSYSYVEASYELYT
jgi:hypothetical protein